MKQLYVNEISHRRFCRMDNNYMSTVRGSGVWFSENSLQRVITQLDDI